MEVYSFVSDLLGQLMFFAIFAIYLFYLFSLAFFKNLSLEKHHIDQMKSENWSVAERIVFVLVHLSGRNQLFR